MTSEQNQFEIQDTQIPNEDGMDRLPDEIDTMPNTMTKWQRIKDIYQYAKKDFIQSRLLGKAAIVGLVGITAYEWGPGNETFTPLLTGQVLDRAGGLGGIALTAAISGGFVAAEQLASGYLARRTVTEHPRLSKRMFAHFSDSKESEEIKHKTFTELPMSKKIIYPFFLGSSFNVLREAYAVGEMDDNRLRKVSRLSAFVAGLTVSLMGAGVDTINQYYEHNETVQTGLDWTLKNPLFWVGIMAAYFAADHYMNKFRNKRKIAEQDNDESQESELKPENHPESTD
jgi:hypothetical protein